MKVLGLAGSPRRSGNIELIVQEALQGAADKGAEIEMVSLADLNFQFCQGCLECHEKGTCPLNDEVIDLIEKMDQADALIIGSPVYIRHLPGQLKAVFDRLCSLTMQIGVKPNGIMELESKLTKKIRPGLAIVGCSAMSPEMTESALAFLKGFLAVHSNDGKLEEMRIINLGLPGQVKMELGQLEEAVKKYGFPLELAAKIKEDSQAVLKQAWELGEKLVTREE